MLFNPALFTSLLLVPLALAIPSRLAARVSRRREGRHSQPYNGFLEGVNDITHPYFTNWAGAAWAQNDGTFQTVTGTFTVPTPSNTDANSNWVSASAWVGIDGYTCKSALLQTGIDFTVSNGQVYYDAWYEWLPAPASDFSGITISAGDIIKLTVVATSTTTGTATIENLTKSQTVSKSLSSTSPLCQQNAEWIVEDYQMNNQTVSFADFGTVTFTDAQATGTGTYTPSGASIANIEQNGQVLTSVSVSGSSVTINYV